jgi:hypothetical protein
MVRLTDPGSGNVRDYAVLSSPPPLDGDKETTYLAEFQVMGDGDGDDDCGFSSFLVGNHVIKDGNLYLINRIDPLFFVLATQSTGGGGQAKSSIDNDNNSNKNIHHHQQHQHQQQSKKTATWQPYDQFLEQSNLPPEVAEVLSEEQIRHLCLTFENEELYFKFSVDRALRWLQRKQRRVLESLKRQDQQKRKQAANIESRFGTGQPEGGSVSSNFHFGGPPAPTATATANCPANTPSNVPKSAALSPSENDLLALRVESLQIVCNYLNDSWSKLFVEHVGGTWEEVTRSAKEVLRNTTNTKVVVSPDHHSEAGGTSSRSTTSGGRERSKASQQPHKAINVPLAVAAVRTKAQTAGNKRLTKVSTKGMRSIGSFFATAGKTTKKAKR